MEQFYPTASLIRTFRAGLVVSFCVAALGWNSTASAVLVDGIFSPPDNSPQVASLEFQFQNGTTVNEQQGTLAWSVGASGNVFVAFVEPLSINDNTYGTNAVGLGSGSHSFGNLTGISSGYDSLGVTGGDGRVTLGNAASILARGTSLDYDLNTIASQYTVNSPTATRVRNQGGTIDYARPYTSTVAPDWIDYIPYEGEIAATDSGNNAFGSVVMPSAHNSPSRFGQNTVPIVPVPEPATYVGGAALIALLLATHARVVRKKDRV